MSVESDRPVPGSRALVEPFAKLRGSVATPRAVGRRPARRPLPSRPAAGRRAFRCGIRARGRRRRTAAWSRTWGSRRRTYRAPIPFGAVELMCGEAEQVHLVAADVERDLADGLGGIGVEDDAAFVAEPADRADRVDRADLVVRGHDRDQTPFDRSGPRDRIGGHAPVLVAVDDRDVPALAG